MSKVSKQKTWLTAADSTHNPLLAVESYCCCLSPILWPTCNFFQPFQQSAKCAVNRSQKQALDQPILHASKDKQTAKPFSRTTLKCAAKTNEIQKRAEGGKNRHKTQVNEKRNLTRARIKNGNLYGNIKKKKTSGYAESFILAKYSRNTVATKNLSVF